VFSRPILLNAWMGSNRPLGIPRAGPTQRQHEGRQGTALAIQQSPRSFDNGVLVSLPPKERDALKNRFSLASFDPAATVQQTGEIVEHVYFPTSGVASLQIDMGSCSVDTALVGRDSMLSAMAAVKSRRSSTRCITRTAMTALKISAREFRQLARIYPAILKASIDYNESLLHQTQTNAARYSRYPVDVRLALCLMEASHLLASDTLPFGQETLGEMLAVRRSSVTNAALALRGAGAIDYSRGRIVILDRSVLVRVSRI
jgi:CRP-like cAMP-binding protein